eukprot:121575-Chlamydomonas_euryale.AAC.1
MPPGSTARPRRKLAPFYAANFHLPPRQPTFPRLGRLPARRAMAASPLRTRHTHMQMPQAGRREFPHL